MNTSTYQHRELQVLLQSEWSVASRIYYFATPNVLHIHPFEREDCTDMGLGFTCWVDVQHIQYTYSTHTHARTHARTHISLIHPIAGSRESRSVREGDGTGITG